MMELTAAAPRRFLLLLVCFCIMEPCTGHQREKRSLGDRIAKKNWTVVTILSNPYTMYDSERGFKGFIPDLLDLLSKRLGITFDLYLSPDGKYGSRQPDGTWNGMIGEVIKMENGQGGADLAAADITITSGRERVVNFVHSFQDLGLTILMKKPRGLPLPSFLQQILGVYSLGTWIAYCIAFILTILALWLVNRFNPYEYGQCYERGLASKADSEAFTLSGSFWFISTSLFWQGYERTPRSVAGKILVSVWFVFVTLSFTTFIAILVIHTLWHQQSSPNLERPTIQSLNDLANQTDIEYGCIRGGSTFTYFRNSPFAVHQKMAQYMMNSPSSLTSSTKDGVERVKKGGYAFIMESLMAEYTIHRQCSLMTVGKPFAERSFGMAIPNNIDLDTQDALHMAILELRQTAQIEELEEQWWLGSGICKQGEVDEVKYPSIVLPPSLSTLTFWPVLVLLLVGIVVSIIVGLVEAGLHYMRGKFSGQAAQTSRGIQLDDTSE